MPKPRGTSVTIDGAKFDVLSVQVGVHTHHDHTGMPQMGTLACGISCAADANDNVAIPFDVLKKLWELANVVTRDKVKDIQIDFWTDDSQQDAICTYKFRGWISSYTMSGGGGGNHTLNLELQPALGDKNFVDIAMGN